MSLAFWRAHGLGNDYLVLESGGPVDAGLVRQICDRHRGVGADGVLEPFDAEGYDAGVRIWNPDGSIAEKSDNGLRIFAWWRSGGKPADLTVWTGSAAARCIVGAEDVEVEMGTAMFSPASVGLDAPGPLIDGVVAGHEAATALSVGNPHCVLFRQAPLDTLPWRQWGAQLEVHPVFLHRTNVQIARVVGPHRLAARIWERGAGETLASGSSATAVAAAAVKTGRMAAGSIVVAMPGGELTVVVSGDGRLLLRGPVAPIARVVMDPGWP